MSISSFTSAFFGESWLQWSGDTLIATALLMAIVMLIRKPVARIFGPQLSYLLWLIPLARLFVPVFTQTIEVEAPVKPFRDGPLAQLGEAVTGQSAGATQAVETSQNVLSSIELVPALLTVWLGGAAIFIIVQLAIYLQQRREILADARLIEQIDGIRIIEVADIDGPFAFGIFSRFIAVPLDFTMHYTPAEQRLALEHELSHHRSRDLWANFAAMFLLALHWFNPLAWLAYRFFRFDQEAACDARVLAAADEHERAQYSRLIAKAATGRTLALASPLTPHPFAPKNILKERLTLMNQKPKSRIRRALGSVTMLGGTGAAMALTATVCNAYVVKQPIEEVELVPSAVAAAPEAPEPPQPPEAPESRELVEVVTSGDDGDFEIIIHNTDWDDKAQAKAAKKRAKALAKAAEARAEALWEREEALREAREARTEARWAREEALIEAREARREALREAEQARRDALRAAEEARREGVIAIRVNERDARKIVRTTLLELDADTLVPDISFTRDCSKGKNSTRTVSRTVNGRTVMMVSMCDAERLAEARATALSGLKEACREIENEEDIPAEFRDRMVRTFERQIERLEADAT